MNLAEHIDLSKLIQEIERELCTNCRVGKALAELRKLFDLERPQNPVAADKPVSEPVAESKKKVPRTKAPLGILPEKRTCKVCKIAKALDNFPKNSGCIGGHTSTCKKCTYARAKGRAASDRKLMPGMDAAPEPDPPVQAKSQKPSSTHPFECPTCQKRFALKTSLAEHIRMRHPANVTDEL